MRAVIATCSPAGSTRTVGRLLAQACLDQGMECMQLDLGRPAAGDRLAELVGTKDACDCLFIGCPVYANRALPSVLKAIEALPTNDAVAAIPFVTWGCVSSGIALHELGQALCTAELRLMAAATVPTPHSLTWRAPKPTGHQHPNRLDRQRLRDLVLTITARLNSGSGQHLSLAALAYQPPEVHAAMAGVGIEALASRMPGKTVHAALCSGCGTCVEACPVQAISLDCGPLLASHCIHCFNCVRLCPEGAIVADVDALCQRVQDRAKQATEANETRIFI
jgi:ferredoxin